MVVVCNGRCLQWSLFAVVVVCNSRCLQWSLLAMVIVGNGGCWQQSLLAMVVVGNGRCWQWSLFAMVVVGNGRCWQWSLMFLLAMVLPPMNRSASCEHCLSYLYGIVMDCWCYSLTIPLSPYYALLETREHVCYKCEGRKSPETFFDKIPSYSVKNKDWMRTL